MNREISIENIEKDIVEINLPANENLGPSYTIVCKKYQEYRLNPFPSVTADFRIENGELVELKNNLEGKK